jgi:hypothetical protein
LKIILHKVLSTTLLLAFYFFANAQNANFTYAICGRGNSISPWTDIRKINLSNGETEIIYEEGKIEYLLNTLDRGIPEVVLDALTPMGQGVASCGFDASKHRLYFSTMEFADLRFINLQSEEPSFTIVNTNIIRNPSLLKSETQFSRMTIANDGYGYMLNNDATHFIRFTLDKKPILEDLGSLFPEGTPKDSVQQLKFNPGGDMLACKDGSLLLLTTTGTVFTIDVHRKTYTYITRISNLPAGFTVNGICTYDMDNLLIASALSLNGLFKVSTKNWMAEPIFPTATPFACSDLDNGIPLQFTNTLSATPDHSFGLIMNAIKKKEDKIISPKEDMVTALGFYPIYIHKREIELHFSKDELGLFQIILTDFNGKPVAERQQEITESNAVVQITSKTDLKKGLYYIKATHPRTGHVYVKKMEIE